MSARLWLTWVTSVHIKNANLGHYPYILFETFQPVAFTYREVMERFATTMSTIARLLAGVLAKNMHQQKLFFDKNCSENTCFLRLNRYPPCTLSPEVYGLVPHTDSAFLTIVHQDHVGGLQLMKDSRWVAVKPNPSAFIVNIGDLFQVNMWRIFSPS